MAPRALRGRCAMHPAHENTKPVSASLLARRPALPTQLGCQSLLSELRSAAASPPVVAARSPHPERVFPPSASASGEAGGHGSSSKSRRCTRRNAHSCSVVRTSALLLQFVPFLRWPHCTLVPRNLSCPFPVLMGTTTQLWRRSAVGAAPSSSSLRVTKEYDPFDDEDEDAAHAVTAAKEGSLQAPPSSQQGQIGSVHGLRPFWASQ